MSVSIDGRAVEAMRMTHAMGSHWTARVVCETYGPGATASIDDDDGNTWFGRVVSVIDVGNSTHVTLTGGAGDWDAEIPPAHWVASTTVGAVAAGLAQSAGATAEPSPVPLPQWRHQKSRLAGALNVLSRWGGVEWYQRPTGEIVFGVPQGEALTEPIANDGESITYDIGARLPMLLSAAVGRALYLFEAGAERWTATTWPRRAVEPARVSGWIGGTVDSQASELVDVSLDDGSIRTGIPLWSCPGVRAIVPNGTRVLVFDVGGDPRACVAFASQWTADVDSLELAGGGGTALRDGDFVVFTDVPAPFPGGKPPGTGDLFLAGILPVSPVMIKLHPLIAVAPPNPPGLGPSKVTL